MSFLAKCEKALLERYADRCTDTKEELKGI